MLHKVDKKKTNIEKNNTIAYTLLIFIFYLGNIVPVNSSRDDKLLIAFGKHLRKIRERKKISQEKLGLDANSYQSTIIRIEQGKSNPKLSSLIAIAKALNIPPKELLNFSLSGND